MDGRTDQLNFEFSLDATSLETGTWTPVAALNFITPNTVTIGAKDGNSAPNRTSFGFDITGLNIANGNTFWIRWVDTDANGADDGLAVDDFSLRAVPEPSAFILASLGIVALFCYRRAASRERTIGWPEDWIRRQVLTQGLGALDFANSAQSRRKTIGDPSEGDRETKQHPTGSPIAIRAMTPRTIMRNNSPSKPCG